MYPKGATKSGLHDMAGNVWEWTLSQGKNYPYDPKCNEREGSEWRVLRGGSRFLDSGAARCAYRRRLDPVLWFYHWGLQVVVSLANSEFWFLFARIFWLFISSSFNSYLSHIPTLS